MRLVACIGCVARVGLEQYILNNLDKHASLTTTAYYRVDAAASSKRKRRRLWQRLGSTVIDGRRAHVQQHIECNV